MTLSKYLVSWLYRLIGLSPRASDLLIIGEIGEKPLQNCGQEQLKYEKLKTPLAIKFPTFDTKF